MPGFRGRPLTIWVAVESSIRCITNICSRDSLWVILSLRIRSTFYSDIRVAGETPASLLTGCQPG